MKIQYCLNCGWEEEDGAEKNCPNCGGTINEQVSGEDEESDE